MTINGKSEGISVVPISERASLACRAAELARHSKKASANSEKKRAKCLALLFLVTVFSFSVICGAPFS
jgi:hypothetical protein